MSLIDKVLSISQSQVGVREAGGNNRGLEVEGYLASVGLPPGQPWCAAFVCWVLRQAGVPERPSTGDTWALEAWGRERKILQSAPRAGDIFLLLDGASRPMHTGFVIDGAGDRVGTIEGNTGGRSDTDGDGVHAKNRPVSACRYVRWADLQRNRPAVKVLVAGHIVPCNPAFEGGRLRGDVRPLAEALGWALRLEGQTVHIEPGA